MYSKVSDNFRNFVYLILVNSFVVGAREPAYSDVKLNNKISLYLSLPTWGNNIYPNGAQTHTHPSWVEGYITPSKGVAGFGILLEYIDILADFIEFLYDLLGFFMEKVFKE